MRRSCLTTPTPRAQFIASSRCGKSSIAPQQRRPRPIRRAASTDLLPWVESTVSSGSNGAAQPCRLDWRRLDCDGVFQRAGGRRALSEVARRRLHDERQLPSGGPRRHRRQPHHDGYRRRDLVQQWGGRDPEVPPNNPVDPANPGTPLPGHSSALSEVENPDPHAAARTTSIPRTATAVARSSMRGPPPQRELRRRFLRQLRGHYPAWRRRGHRIISPRLTPSIKPNCEAGHYYLVNNYNPGYFGNGKNAYHGYESQ